MPSNGHGTAGSVNHLESELSCWFPDPVVCALEERRSRHSSLTFNRWEGHAPSPNNEKRQNRRAPSTSAGEKPDGDGCLDPEASGFSPATGDPIAYRSANKKRKRPTESVTTSWRTWRLGGSKRVGGRLFVRSVSLCLCGFLGNVSGGMLTGTSVAATVSR